MADFTKTLDETLRVFSPGPANKWGTAVFGTDSWGYNGDMDLLIFKVLQESVTNTDTITKQPIRVLSMGSVTLTGDPDLVALQDGSGYDYVLPGGVTDPDDRNFPVYTEDGSTDPGWTDRTEASDDWSEA